MARTYTPKINKHVTYYDAACKPRPGIITGVVDATHVNIRVCHTSQTPANVARGPIDSMIANVPNTWRPA